MRICSLTEHLGGFRGQEDAISEHLSRCSSCKLYWDLIHTLSRHPDATSTMCPGGDVFSRLAARELSERELQTLFEHAASCVTCQERIRLVRRRSKEETPFGTLLATAERELDAYVLAKEIAEWLSTEEYPEEKEAVDAAFDLSYERTSEMPRTDKELQPMALGFGDTTPQTLAQRIISLSLTSACVLLSGARTRREIASVLERNREALEAQQLGGDLLAAVIHKLVRA